MDTKKLTEMTDAERTEHVCKLIADLADVVKTESVKSAETQAKIDRIVAELTATQRKVQDFETILDTKLEKISDDGQQKIFDVNVKDSSVVALWGYHDPITKALYKPRTRYNAAKGCYEKVGGYDGLEDLMALNDALLIFGMAKAQRDNNIGAYPKYVRETDTYKLLKAEMESSAFLRKAWKALNTATEAEGAEWVPTAMSAKMIDDLRLQLKVAAMFPELALPLRTGSYEVPLQGARRTAYLVGESTSDTATAIGVATPPSAKLVFTAIKHALRILASYEMEEDAIIPVIPLIQAEIVQSLADAEESAIINGDTSTNHMDSNVTEASDIRKSWMGLRYYSKSGVGNARVDIGTLSTANLRSIRKAMGRFGVDPRELFWLTGISGYIQLLGLSEVITVDKYGQYATVMAGELGKFDGAPIIVSEFLPQNLNAAGVYDNTTKTKTVILLVNRRAFWRGYKGTMLAETERDIEVQQHKVVLSRRLCFNRVWTPGTGEAVVGVGYNLTT